MADQRMDVTKYTHYFNLRAPHATILALILVIIGAGAGLVSTFIIHAPAYSNYLYYALAGISTGIMVVSIPALLTGMLLKTVKRKLQIKHAMFATLAITLAYAIGMVVASALYALLGNHTLAYVFLIAFNALIYGYWFFIDRVAIGHRRGAILFATFQPVINVLMYIPLSKFLFGIGVPIDTLLIKLYSGMIVFLAIGYLSLYLLDRPSKKQLDISGIAIFTAMVSQWLFDVNPGAELLGDGGVKREVSVDVLALRAKRRYKAVFVKPDIHYGPFAYVGGSVTTEMLGSMIKQKYGATPFVMHGAVNINDNPISANQVQNLKKQVDKFLDGISSTDFRKARGTISIGSSGPCRAINIRINGTSLLTLTKAPLVTEDIDKEVGISLEKAAGKDGDNVILVDAHNARWETAPKEELRGIYKGSGYVQQYEDAIHRGTRAKVREGDIRFGSSSLQILKMLKYNKDIGNGYTSVGIFSFGSRKFGMLYFDGNNMLPYFRDGLIAHVREKFGIEIEVYTTDTHHVNTIALSASNAMGRRTTLEQMLPIVDDLFIEAINNMEPVSCAYGKIRVGNFRVWGSGSEERLVRASKDALRMLKYVVPFVIAGGFVIATWIIYIV